ncbi:hypothetical protein AKJ39_03565 [candidate division MSBL1 archaeon SCGC-AAA259J03]|uniref:Kinase n=1 Tax=candidate division MSBL1 archaeon SCGC-AAA259J03 TaxID=1698269 RepID=A0A656YXD2_9EURY|nr:hypothetical protein AKJ39_03565 [candidate division MSBL1 archaeon SCGC-AAA259J03]
MIVIFCGIPACGKSTAAEKLTRRLDDLDIDYKLLVSDEISDKVYEKIFRFIEDNIIQTDYLIVDATFYKEKWRDRVRNIVQGNNEKLLTVYLRCRLETALRRNDRRKENKVSEKAIHIINEELERPNNPDLEINTDETEPEQIVHMILGKLPISELEEQNN